MANSAKRTPHLQVLSLLKDRYPDAHCALEYKNPYELLIATILSAQCTDERVNQVTRILFRRFPTALCLAQARLDEIENIIRPTGFFHNKAKNIKMCCESLRDNYKGEVPQKMEELITLAGVGRKTANVVLGNAYQIPSGIVVDTHVGRLSQRLGWVKTGNPLKIEEALSKKIPKGEWIMLSHYMIAHGRSLCKARNPQCNNCFLVDHCPQIRV